MEERPVRNAKGAAYMTSQGEGIAPSAMPSPFCVTA